MRLPGISGPELQERRLSGLGSTLPIIFVTGFPDIQTTVRTIKAGGEDFLIKPVTSEQLLEAVERAIAHHNAVLQKKQARDAVLSRIAALTPRVHTIKAHRHRVMEKMLDPWLSLSPLLDVSASLRRVTGRLSSTVVESIGGAAASQLPAVQTAGRDHTLSIVDRFEQLLGALQERDIYRDRPYGFTRHDDDVHLWVSAAGILSKFGPGYCTRQVVVSDECLQFRTS